MESGDLRLLLGVARGADMPALADALGVGEITVRRRVRRLAGPGDTRWLRRAEVGGYELTDHGRGLLGPARRAVDILDGIAASLGVDEVSLAHADLIMAVVATGSIGGAARRLRLPQSSVSAKVSRIEQRWRTPLFIRDRTGVLPTAVLADLLPRLALLEQTVTRLRSRTGGDPHAPGSADQFELAVEFGFSGLLEALAADGLEVRQHITEIPDRAWTTAMCRADVCLYVDLPMAGLPVPAGYDTTVAFRDPGYAVVPPDVAAGRTIVSLKELADQDWLTGAIGGRNHSSVVALCRSAGFEPRVRYTSTHSPSGRRILDTGTVAALTSAAFVPDPGLPAVRLAEDVEVRVTVGWRRGGTRASVAHRIVSWLQEAHARRLAAIRPALLAEMRAEPDRWPHLTEHGAEEAGTASADRGASGPRTA